MGKFWVKQVPKNIFSKFFHLSNLETNEIIFCHTWFYCRIKLRRNWVFMYNS